MMLEAVIFDMDGTLVNTEPLYHEVAWELFEEFGIEVTPDEYAKFAGTTLSSMWDYIKKKAGFLHPTHELVNENTKQFIARLREKSHLYPMPGVVALIEEIRTAGLPLAIATSAGRRLMGTTLDLYGLLPYFPVQVCGDDVLYGKPDPSIFLKAAGSIGIEPENIVVFEDSTNGVLGAKRAGMKCVGFTNDRKNHQILTLADLVIDRYADVSVQKLAALF